MTKSKMRDDNAATPTSQTAKPLPPARHRVRPRPSAAASAPASPPPPPPPPPPVIAASPAEDPTPEPKAEHQAKAGKRPYEVGYGKPPMHSRFKPGTSGNPKGRRKNAKGIKTMVRETMTERVPVRTASGVKKMTRMEATIHKAHELAMKGNVRALAQIITLYSAAVPDAAPDSANAAEILTATDTAMLDALLQAIAGPSTPVPVADQPTASTAPLSGIEGDTEPSDPDEALGATASALPVDMPVAVEESLPPIEPDPDGDGAHVAHDDEPDEPEAGEPWPPPRRQW